MTLHVYEEVQQRTPEWFALRRGIVTASNVDKLISTGRPPADAYDCTDCGAKTGNPCLSKAKSKGTPAAIKTFHPARSVLAAAADARVLEVADDDTSRALTATLVAERIAGITEDTFISHDMWRGIDLEPIARDTYSGHHAAAEEVGFMVRREDTWTLGYSPDGLVGADGLLEVKAPRAKGHVLAVLNDEVPAFNMAQIQAGLLVSGRKWLDFIPYVAGLPLWVKRVFPDPKWHEVIVAACERFETTAAQMVADYQAKTAGLPITEPYDPMKVELTLA